MAYPLAIPVYLKSVSILIYLLCIAVSLFALYQLPSVENCLLRFLTECLRFLIAAATLYLVWYFGLCAYLRYLIFQLLHWPLHPEVFTIGNPAQIWPAEILHPGGPQSNLPAPVEALQTWARLIPVPSSLGPKRICPIAWAEVSTMTCVHSSLPWGEHTFSHTGLWRAHHFSFNIKHMCSFAHVDSSREAYICLIM